MKTIQKHTLEKMLATLQLAKATQQYNNTYVFGFDDVVRIMRKEIDSLNNEFVVQSFSCTPADSILVGE
mgnify:CR=1 FL=1